MPEDYAAPLKHLKFNSAPKRLNYTKTGRGSTNAYFERVRNQHAQQLQEQMQAVEQAIAADISDLGPANISPEYGRILNIESEPGFPLSFDQLGNRPLADAPAITLLNLRHEETGLGIITKAAVFVPHGQLHVLSKKIADYGDATKDNLDRAGDVTGPSNGKLLINIASIAIAAFEALWTDPSPLPEVGVPTWLELWVRRDRPQWQGSFYSECERLGLPVTEQKLILPEHVVVVLKADRSQLESSIDLLNTLSEIRVARPCKIGLTDLSGLEQEEWLDITLDRIEWPSEDAPAVCLIDSGVNRGHALIEPLLREADSDTVFADGDRSDDLSHGTPMAGLAAFGDLRNLILSSGIWRQSHRLESVKLVRASSEHNPENYGSITLQAITRAEISAAQRARIFCMAITIPGPNTEGNPSAWSSAIDMAAAGVEEGGAGIPRVILISAGNLREHSPDFSYPSAVDEAPIEDPAQAWNAISVGAVTSRIDIEEADDEARRSVPLAPEYGVSPFTRTSHTWRPDWPLGPDIVMEGGNLGRSQNGDCLHIHSLKPLTTSTDFRRRPLEPFGATSAATAQAARMAAMIAERYPDYKAETIRGLLVHSARWPEQLLEREGLNPHRSGNTGAVETLMRSYGYGIVDEKRVLSSLQNETTFVTEGTIQPYKGMWNDPKLNECHMVALPWPVELLREHPDNTATLRVTLSYFTQPNPGSRTWSRSSKYHYASCLLRFQPKHRDMSAAEFEARLNAAGESSGDTFSDPGWAVGSHRRNKAGSLVQDIWKGTTGQLAEMGHIGIYPAKGWWAYRHFRPGHDLHGCHLRPVNYTLVISLETDAELPLYTKISAAINTVQSTPSVEIQTELF